jgi:L-fuculose-phosphate aldolase
MTHQHIIEELVEVGRRFDRFGWVPSTDGNFSVRLSPREILATVSGVKKGFLTPKDFVVIDPEGAPLRGGGRVSTEILMHLRIYRDRADAMAVVHAHPPTATGFAVAGMALDACILPEVVSTIGAVPLAPYATPSTEALPESIAPYLDRYDAILLANHGVVAFGPSLFAAANRMETVEQFAKILFTATLLGQVNRLSGGQVAELNAIRHRYGLSGPAPACRIDPAEPVPPGGNSGASKSGDTPPEVAPALVEEVLAEVLRQLQIKAK